MSLNEYLQACQQWQAMQDKKDEQRKREEMYLALQQKAWPNNQAWNQAWPPPQYVPLPSWSIMLATQVYEPPKPKPVIDPAKLAALQSAEPRMITARMPDSIIPIVAWRAWSVKTSKNDWKLAALGQSDVWPAKKMMTAKCRSNGGHPVPHRDCQCGVWSFHSLDTLLAKLDGYTPKVIGQVTIWGRIIECENGFRSQFAYPKELWLLDPAMEQLGHTYGVPVRTA